MTEYVRVDWHHADPAEPVVVYIELDADRYEVRKVEQYLSGQLDFADTSRYTGTTFLSESPVPSLVELATNTEFTPLPIAPSEFARIWLRATR